MKDLQITEAEDRATRALDEMTAIENQWGADRAAWPQGQAERHDRLNISVKRTAQEIEDLRSQNFTRAEKLDALRDVARHGVSEAGFYAPDGTGGDRRRSDPWAAGSGDDILRMDSPSGLHTRAQDAVEYAHGLPAAGRSLLASALDKDTSPQAAAFVIAATSDEYRSAFGKIMADPDRGHLLWTEAERESYARVQSMRTAMSTTAGNGGYLIPLQLDSNVLFTNSGTASSIRRVARVEVGFSDKWNGVTSAGLTSSWVAENTAVSEGSPTFGRVEITARSSKTFVVASFEVTGDTNIAEQLPRMVADARARQEAAAFITGNGTSEPEGVVTAVAAVTASRVSPTTGGAFSAASEVYLVHNALTARARQSESVAWVANNTIINTIRQFDVYGGSSFIADLGEGQPPTLLGAPLYEASDMSAAVTTGSSILLAGDWSEFIIYDRLGTTVEYVPMVFDGDGKPMFQRGWAAFARTGSKVADPGAFRIMQL